MVTTYVLTPPLLLTSYFPFSCSCTNDNDAKLCIVLCDMFNLTCTAVLSSSIQFGVFSRHIGQMPQWVFLLPAMMRI